jgi:hypothetical protein
VRSNRASLPRAPTSCAPSGSPFAIQHHHHRDEHADSHGALEGERDERPLERRVSAHDVPDDVHGKQRRYLRPRDTCAEEQPHPEPVKDDRRDPEESGAFRQTHFARVARGAKHLHACVAFADEQLPRLEEQKDRRGVEHQSHRSKG